MRRLIVLTWLLGLGCASVEEGSNRFELPDHDAYVLLGATVAPMDREEAVEQAAVRVEEGVITWVGPASELGSHRLPTVELAGAWIMPGLIDMHVHLADVDELDLYLANGVTTVANLSGRPEHLKWREEIRDRTLTGPTIFTAGPTIDGDPPRNSRFIPAGDRAAAEAAVLEIDARGYDFVKIYDLIERDAYRGAVDAARRAGIPIVGHIPKQIGLEGILGGHDLVAHAEEFFYTYFGYEADRNRIPEVVRLAADAGLTVCPNTGFLRGILEQVEDIEAVLAWPEVRYLSPGALLQWLPEGNRYLGRDEEWIARNRLQYPFLVELTGALHDGGVRLVAGTDAAVAGAVPGFALHRELEDLEKAGLSRFEALQAATIHSGDWLAEHLELPHPPGAVAPGRAADLLILASDPLDGEEDLADSLLGVIARGRPIDLAALRERMEGRAEGHAAALVPYEDFKTAIARDDYGSAEELVRAAEDDVLGEAAVNRYGYYWLLRQNDPERAIAVFAINTRVFPGSGNVWDSLGEAYRAAGRIAESLESYRRSLELDPSNNGARRAIEEMNG